MVQHLKMRHLWRGSGLRRADEWMPIEKPTKAWAERHCVRNWDACLTFLEQSRSAADKIKEEAEASARQAQEEKARQHYEDMQRQKRLLTAIGAIARAFFIAGSAMTYMWNSRKESKERAEKAAADRLARMQTIGKAVVPIVESGEAAISEAAQQTAKLTEGVQLAAVAAPPEQGAIEDFRKARGAADRAVAAIDQMAKSLEQAARITADSSLAKLAQDLRRDAIEIRKNRDALQRRVLDSGVEENVTNSSEVRLQHAEEALEGLQRIDQRCGRGDETQGHPRGEGAPRGYKRHPGSGDRSWL